MINDIEILTPRTLKFELEKQVYRALIAAGFNGGGGGGTPTTGLTREDVQAMIVAYCGDTTGYDVLAIYDEYYTGTSDVDFNILDIYASAYGAA